MEQRISLVTLGVADLARARAYYEQLGWHGQEVQETVSYRPAGSRSSCGNRDKLAADYAGVFADPDGHVWELAHNPGFRPERDGSSAASPGAVRFARSIAASLLFAFAPHVATDAFHRLTGERVWEQPWPTGDRAFIESATFELVLQVNGKIRDRVQAPSDASRDELIALARESERVPQFIDGNHVVKEIVPGKLVNVVVRPA